MNPIIHLLVTVCISNNITIMSNNNIKAYEKEFICPFYRRGYWGLRRRADWTIITQLVEIYLVLKLVSSDLKFRVLLITLSCLYKMFTLQNMIDSQRCGMKMWKERSTVEQRSVISKALEQANLMSLDNLVN